VRRGEADLPDAAPAGTPAGTLTLYRGQAYGVPAGSWWTPSLEEARAFAMQYRAWVVLSVEVPEAWASQFLRFDDAEGEDEGRYYRIPPERMKEAALALEVYSGRLGVAP
jgi:hypothetical protein